MANEGKIEDDPMELMKIVGHRVQNNRQLNNLIFDLVVVTFLEADRTIHLLKDTTKVSAALAPLVVDTVVSAVMKAMFMGLCADGENVEEMRRYIQRSLMIEAKELKIIDVSEAKRFLSWVVAQGLERNVLKRSDVNFVAEDAPSS